MAKNERFEKVYSQGTMNVMEIWVDRETGVNYVFHAGGYAGGNDAIAGQGGKTGDFPGGEQMTSAVGLFSEKGANESLN